MYEFWCGEAEIRILKRITYSLASKTFKYLVITY